MRVLNDFQTLLTFAEAYFHLGYSVIPLLGDHDSSRSKVPSIPWAAYQKQRPSLHDHQHWFAQPNAAGLGIVTGSVSHLIVLDFDTEAAFKTFSLQHPDLTETHTVRSATRQLPHLYFRLPSHLSIPSQKGQGIDLLSDGRYVVAPPTTLNGIAYKVARGGQAKTLTERDLRRIQAFLTSHKPAAHPAPAQRSAPVQPAARPPKPTAHDLERIYQHHRQKGQGRNEALFRTAIYARNTGWTALETQACLIPLHIHQTASDQHTHETSAHRQREATATIRSAFSRLPVLWGGVGGEVPLSPLPVTTGYQRSEPANAPMEGEDELDSLHRLRERVREGVPTDSSPLSHAVERGLGGEDALSPLPVTTGYQRSEPANVLMGGGGWGTLPNSVREALMQMGMTYFVRTYEGLMLAGFKPDQTITTTHALDKLKGVVGRGSILNALHAQHNNQPLFTPVSPRYAVATENQPIDSKECSFEGRKNRQKIGRGRPQHRFKIPTNEDLCRILGVKSTGSDPLEQADLASASKTRMALHRELIKRRPGPYPRRWQAQRLGVDVRTIDAYNRLIPIHSRAMHIETTVNWGNIARLLPLDEPLQGAVLIGKEGKRYPALRTIAARLLSREEVVTLKQQTANFYWYGDTEPFIERMHIQQERVIQQQRIEAFMAKQPQVVPVPPAPKPKPAVIQPKPPKNLHRQLKNAEHEAQAQSLYQTMSRISPKSLSMANARRLTTTYPAHIIQSALSLLQNHPRITNPVGFFITSLRSTARAL